MIRVNIPLSPIFDSQEKGASYSASVMSALAEIRSKTSGTLRSDDFKSHWKIFKYNLWIKQDKKCCFCEQKINEQDSQVDHYRPKTQIKTKQGDINGYWWLAYEWLNLIAVCATCNRQKTSEFPLVAEAARVLNEMSLDAKGTLDREQPMLINPRFDDPESYFEYDVSQCFRIGEVYIKGKDSDTTELQRGNTTKRLLDLNRQRVNKEKDRDNLPGKRGKSYLAIRNLLDNCTHVTIQLHKLKSDVLPNLDTSLVALVQIQIRQVEEDVAKLEEQIRTSRSSENEFAGLIRWYTSMRRDSPKGNS